ncbi:MAG: hypothetical protein CM15mP70_11490 [Pelagibacteraceae bacterium]|nr:MAG: hypothetical protein CM15mP70_11490 [Pelagibacteraceae bacterium]
MIYLKDSYIKEFHAPIVAVEEEKLSLRIAVFTPKVEDSLETKGRGSQWPKSQCYQHN